MTENTPKVVRSGNTSITSVSLSKEFRKLMEDYNISPTEAMRKGVAIELFDRGLPQFQSEINEQRYKELQSVVKKNEMQDLPIKLKEVENLLSYIREMLEVIK